MRVGPYRMAQVDHPAFLRAGLGGLPYSHQAELYDRWGANPVFLVATPTGSGKTRAAAFPIIERGENAIFLYPTNALIEDQERSILALLHDLGTSYYQLVPGLDWDSGAYRRADVVLARVDSAILEDFRRSRHRRAKGSVLAEILGHQEKPLLILTNPDTLFQILVLRYRSGFEILSRVSAFGTLVIDEFHLYGGVELANIVFMSFALLRDPSMALQRVVFLSATPPDDVLALLHKVFNPTVIRSRPATDPTQPSRTVLHTVDLNIRPAIDMVSAIADQILQLRPELERLRGPQGFVPLVVILNSVLAAIALEDALVRRGIRRTDLGIYRGLSNHVIRDIDGKLLVLGTSAIEVGMDLHARYLIFEASSARSFLQRLGRIGRHEEGVAWLYAPGHVVQAARKWGAEVTRADLERLAYQWYPDPDAQPWFAATRTGLLSAGVMLERQCEGIKDAGVGDALRQRHDELLRSYSECLGVIKEYRLARHELRRGRDWLRAYSQAQTFRSSGISLAVFDVLEARRRGRKELGAYEASLRLLLERAKLQSLKRDRSGDYCVVIAGFGQKTRVDTESSIPDDVYGMLYPASQVSPYFLTQHGSRSELSDVVQRGEHVVVKVPREAEADFDWRMDFYPTRGGHLLFDGNALLAYEMCRRRGLFRP